MSGRASRRKGAAGEREVARILATHGFPARRTPNSGGLALKGDLTGTDGGPCLPGYHLEVKRCETLALPKWLAQAHADASADTPLLVFRRDARRQLDPLADWHVTLPLIEFLSLLVELREQKAAA